MPRVHLLRATLALLTVPALALAESETASESIVEYIQVESDYVKRSVGAGVYLPPGYESSGRRYPVLYFLHGMFGNERKWESRGCPQMLDDLIARGDAEPMIVVTPAGYNGFWINWVNGKADWEDFLVDELVPAIDAKYRTVPAADARAVSGDSMGGYGALNLAFKHPDRFGSVSAHSAMLYPVDLSNLPGWIQENMNRWSPIYGDPVDMAHWKGNHPLHLAETLDASVIRGLGIYFDCGTSDRFGFDVGATDLHEILDRRKVAHEFALRDGNHGRDYFGKYAPMSLEFHGRAFKAALAERAAGVGESGEATTGDQHQRGG